MRTELQAFVAAGGRGSRLPSMPGVPPKCLLPVGPCPLIWYPLNLLETQGFREVTVIVLDNERGEIVSAVDKCHFKMKIDYVTIPSDEDLGTADSLRLIHDRIHADVLFVSCDLVTEADLDGTLDLYRKHDASVVTLAFDNGPTEFIQVPGPKTKDRPERDFFGVDDETQRLVFLASSSDFEETVPLSRRLIKKHPAMTVRSRLLDSHVYILKKWIVDFLSQQKERNFTTVKGELLPYIVKKQLSKPGAVDVKDASVSHVEINKDIYKYAREDGLESTIRKLSSYNDHVSGTKGCYHDDIVRCYTFIPPRDGCYAVRVNTLSAYRLINSKIIEKWNDIVKSTPLVKIHPTSDVKSKQVDESTIVGEQSVVSEKTSIKATIIGSNCLIENKVRLTNCILMNDVTIKEGCNLQDCILYSGVTVGTDCTLKLCLVGPKYKMPAKKNETQQTFSEISDMITVG